MSKTITTTDLISISLKTAFFIIFLPLLFIIGGEYLETHFLVINYPAWLRTAIILVSLPVGLILLPWAIFSKWKTDHRAASSNPLSPTFIVVGPFFYCRNPITLGAMLYYLGIGTLVTSLTAGLIGFLGVFLLGSVYFFLFYEPSMLKFFKSDYRNYKESIPIIIPRFKKKKF